MTYTVERLQVFEKKVQKEDAMLEYKQIGPSMGNFKKQGNTTFAGSMY